MKFDYYNSKFVEQDISAGNNKTNRTEIYFSSVQFYFVVAV